MPLYYVRKMISLRVYLIVTLNHHQGICITLEIVTLNHLTLEDYFLTQIVNLARILAGILFGEKEKCIETY